MSLPFSVATANSLDLRRRIAYNAANPQATTARVSPLERSALYRSDNVDSNSTTQQSQTQGAGQGSSPSTSDQKIGGTHSVGCPYHEPIIRMLQTVRSQQRNVSPMDRFLGEGPSEAYAVLVRADTGRLSTSRECTCYIRTDNAN